MHVYVVKSKCVLLSLLEGFLSPCYRFFVCLFFKLNFSTCKTKEMILEKNIDTCCFKDVRKKIRTLSL